MADYLSGWAGSLSSYVTPIKPLLETRVSKIRAQENADLQKDHEATLIDSGDSDSSSIRTSDSENLDQSTPIALNLPKKRAGTPSAKTGAKRRKQDDAAYQALDEGSDSELEGETLLPTPAHKGTARQSPGDRDVQDRKRMPPPASPFGPGNYTPDPKLIDRDLRREDRIVRADAEDPDLSDDELLSQRNQVKKTDRREVAYDFDHERARRHADAVELPQDSGYWSNAEKDLFFRLAMRGFEPLVPASWSLDFKTLPVSLFTMNSAENPFINSYEQREFRAIYFLRLLFSTGMRVRDRRIMGLRSEPIMRRILYQYMSWALYDAEVHPSQRPHTIPVYTLTTMRKNEKAQNALDRMTRRLHKIAFKYHDLHGIYPSVESEVSSNDDTISEDDTGDDLRFPVLTGILICSSIVLVVTLDTNPSRFRPLPPPSASLTPNLAPQQDKISKEDSGLRVIATFDFSDHGMDVWNSLAIAIVVMRIRKTMREMMERASKDAGMWKMVTDAVSETIKTAGGFVVQEDDQDL